MSGQIVPRKERYNQLTQMLESRDGFDAIRKALPHHLTPERMVRVVLTAVGQNPKLLECTPVSVMRAVIESASLGLMPDGVLGQAYLVPYKDKCQLIIGYKGLLKLARQSGEIASIESRIVYEGDSFDFSYGLEQKLSHVKAQMLGLDPGKPWAAYAVVRFHTGEIFYDVMFRDEIEAIRQKAISRNSDAWVNHWDEMAKKTVLRRVCKYLPLSTEVMDRAVTVDEAQESGHMEVLDSFGGSSLQPDAPEEEPKAGLDRLTEELQTSPETVLEAPETGQELEPPEGAQEAASPAPGPAGRRGRITDTETNEFLLEVQTVVKKMGQVQDEDGVSRFYNRTLGGHGVESPEQIRSRQDRERFLKDLRDMEEQWRKAGRF